MKCLVTGGAGFIGRWVVEHLLDDGHQVVAFDDLSSGRAENLEPLRAREGFLGLVEGDLKDTDALARVFASHTWDGVFHLGASINVQRSIDDPSPTFRNDTVGTFNLLEACRRQYFTVNRLSFDERAFDYARDLPKLTLRSPRVVVMSTCMVYAPMTTTAITESHPYRPASPYAAAKIGADMLALSYHASYDMPVSVVRPFNTYGPYQKSNSEGGVVAVFLKRDIDGNPLLVKGSGEQTRDLLYVEDCADFVVRCAFSDNAEGRVINAGTGSEVSVNELASLCRSSGNEIVHVAHDHPQAEIARLCCDASLAERLIGWTPTTRLSDGIQLTRDWLRANRWAW